MLLQINGGKLHCTELSIVPLVFKLGGEKRSELWGGVMIGCDSVKKKKKI